MPPDPSFDELIRQVGNGDEQAAARLVRDFEPVARRVLRARLRGARARQEFDSMDICQSVFAIFFVRVAAGQYDLKEPDDLIKLLLTMTRNKVAEKMRHQHRLRLSWEEVAASLGGTAGARRNQLARALDRVAQELRLDEP